jgi:hypothetical protein
MGGISNNYTSAFITLNNGIFTNSAANSSGPATTVNLAIGSLGGTVSTTTGTTLTINGVISGSAALAIGETGKAGTVIFSGASSTYSGNISVGVGTLRLTGALPSTINIAMTGTSVWDLQVAQTVASLTMASGNSITRVSGTSSLTVTGASTLANSITTSGLQTYSGAVTLAANTTLTTTNSNVTFNSTINGTTAATQSLTIANGSGLIVLGGNVGSGATLSSINFSSATATTILAGSVSTSGAQTYSGNMYVAVSSPSLTSTSGGITITGTVSTGALIQLVGTSTGSYIFNNGSATSISTTPVVLGALSFTYSGGSYAINSLVNQSVQYLIVGGGGAGGLTGCNGCNNGGGGGGGGAVSTGTGSLNKIGRAHV